MRKITLLALLALISTFSFAANGWFSDFLTISVNGASTTDNYYIGADPATGATALQAKAFGLVTSLELSGVDMMYWSDVQDRTGSAVYYKITNSSNTFEFVPATEIILDHTFIMGNNYQGTKSLSVNLLAGLPAGAYQLHVWAKSWSGAGGEGDSWLSNNSANYVATFMKAPASTSPMSGTYKVGNSGTADFNSLSGAINAVNSYGVGGNVLFEIVSNLSEPNVGLGVNTGTYSITFKPAATITPTITFVDGTTSQNIDGHFVIGSPTVTNTNLISTNNVIIDGSNTVGGTTKDLTINGPVTTNQRSVIRIYGNNDNITIKNCTITNNSSSSSSTSPINVTDYTTFACDNLIIQNNTLVSNSGNGGVGVQISVTGTPTALMTGIKVQNNIITARATRAVFFNYVSDGEISGNTISHDCQITGSAAATIAIMSGGSGVAGTFNIFNNKIIKSKTWNTTNAATASVGIIAIDNQLASPKIVNIFNNFITGLEISSSTVNSVKIYGIRHTGGSTSNIYHNTIVVPDMTDMSTMTNSYLAGIAFATAASPEAAPTGTMNVNNNIIISRESSMKVWGIRRVGNTGTFSSNNNIIYASTSNNYIGFYNASDALALSDWRTASSQDANSKLTNVVFANEATGDLSIAGLSVQDINLKVPFLAAVSTDIFGTVRNTEFTYAGAHESVLPFLSTGLTIGDNQQARILRTMSGVKVELEGESDVELYSISGALIDKARVNGTYTHDLNNGVYVIRIDGKATKFMK